MTAESTELPTSRYYYSRILSGLGAVGVALQNYPAVELFVSGLLKGVLPASSWSSALIQSFSLSTGGLCSGMVNFWMNVELLDGFIERINSTDAYQYEKLADEWALLQYFGGIFVFVVTGVLYGLMAFTFAMEGPLAALSIAAGLFVAGIMTIQELETWFVSYDKWFASHNQRDIGMEESLTPMKQLGKNIGHLIAIGNVIALSLLFTLSLAEGLIALQFAALPALIAGFSVAFTFGAFTEYYFYHYYLADFCENAETKLASMLTAPHAWIGFLCVSTNAFVNAALTYAGIGLLTGLLMAASIALPPVAAVTALAVVSALFSGSASFVLGMDFWIRNNKPQVALGAQDIRVSPIIMPKQKVSMGKNAFSIFAENQELQNNHGYDEVGDDLNAEISSKKRA